MSSKVIDYIILQSNDMPDLERQVKEYLKRDYELYGDLGYVQTTHYRVIYQAMVKYEEKKE